MAASSTTQVPISMSSGEAEYYVAAKSGSRLLGAVSMLRDLGIMDEINKPVLETDSASAKGTMSKRGVDGIRHLETSTL